MPIFRSVEVLRLLDADVARLDAAEHERCTLRAGDGLPHGIAALQSLADLYQHFLGDVGLRFEGTEMGYGQPFVSLSIHSTGRNDHPSLIVLTVPQPFNVLAPRCTVRLVRPAPLFWRACKRNGIGQLVHYSTVPSHNTNSQIKRANFKGTPTLSLIFSRREKGSNPLGVIEKPGFSGLFL